MHLAASLCVVVSAWGVHCGHPTLDARVKYDQAIAEQQWPGHPCAGREQLVWDVQGVVDAGLYYFNETCVIHLAPWLRDWGSRIILCRVIVHEEGHQIGLMHSTDKYNIMYPNSQDVIYPPCDKQ